MRLMTPKPDFKNQKEIYANYENFREDVRYVVVSGQVVKLCRDPDTDLYKDDWGTIWALPEYENSTDRIARCGVGFFSFRINNPLTSYCSTHDYMYSSPTFQYFHTRYEADVWLYKAIENHAGFYRILALPIYYITYLGGRFFWENETTKIEEAKRTVEDFKTNEYYLAGNLDPDKHN